MNIEYEATFLNVNKDTVREKFKKAGAELVRPEFLQKRIIFNFPEGHEVSGGWVRVRDEGDKITMSVKIIDGDSITDQKETCLTIDSFEEGVEMLKTIGCVQKSYQETKRELWILNNVEITIDEWPFLEPFVEVEGTSEESVKEVSQIIGFEWEKARFCAVGTLYAEKYNILETIINNDTSKITFEMQNPFVKK
ncbi:MAG: CYTH domain-containing protein [Candidatus Pacebacteria bacterium]|nr:CYTH domain-containing protein [Candidatus Paceibacterota bacterium]